MAAENDMDPAELLDYDEEENPPEAAVQNETNGAEAGAVKKPVKGSYVSIHSSGFRDFLLKPELLRAIVDCGFEHPSEGEGGEKRRLEWGYSPVSLNLLCPAFTVTCSLVSPQFRTSVYLRLSSAWTWCAKPRVVWVRQPSLSLPPYSSWSPWTTKLASWSCATPGEW